MNKLRLSKAGLVLLMGFEALRLVPYRDGAGVWTDGYGNTHGVVPGRPITVAKAEADLRRHTDTFADVVWFSLKEPVSQRTFDSYVTFTHNIGGGGWKSSQVLVAHNAGKPMDACLYMLRWTKITDPKTKKKVESRGVWNRRYIEYNECIAGVPNAHWHQVPRRGG